MSYKVHMIRVKNPTVFTPLGVVAPCYIKEWTSVSVLQAYTVNQPDWALFKIVKQ